MKKNLLSFVLCALLATFTSVSFVSCGMGESTLEAAIEQVNATYPQDLGGGLTIENIEMVGKDIIYNCSVDGSVLPIESIEAVKDVMGESVLTSLKESYSADENVKTFVDLAVVAGKNIKYVYKDNETGASTDFTIDNSTLAGF